MLSEDNFSNSVIMQQTLKLLIGRYITLMSFVIMIIKGISVAVTRLPEYNQQ